MGLDWMVSEPIHASAGNFSLITQQPFFGLHAFASGSGGCYDSDLSRLKAVQPCHIVIRVTRNTHAEGSFPYANQTLTSVLERDLATTKIFIIALFICRHVCIFFRIFMFLVRKLFRCPARLPRFYSPVLPYYEEDCFR